MPAIVLSTLNARHVHASLGLRYLLANLGPLREDATLMEFTIATRPEVVAERILSAAPRVVGFGVYVWNVEETTKVVAIIKAVAPGVKIVLGGPEVSHETAGQPIVALADHVVTGPGELAFARLARQLLTGPPPLTKSVPGESPPATDTDRGGLGALVPPYAFYDDADIAQRFLYVEASRGCPYKCEFCLSALDRGAVPFPLDAFLAELAALHARGARTFRFVDRTFNLKVDTSLAILSFFLERLEHAPEDPVFAHFELVPDHLPERLKAMIRRFPPGALQFEIGIQTWNPDVQRRISRRQDNLQAEANIAWLAKDTHAHLHVDLIAGLPGEDLASFGAGFDRLLALGPHEIQVGILKRLRGAPIARHAEAFGLRFAPHPPYQVLATDAVSFADMQRIARFARYWDLVGNSGRFGKLRELLLHGPDDSPFGRFMAWSDWLWATTGNTHGFAVERLHELLLEWLRTRGGVPPDEALDAARADYASSGAQGRPSFMARGQGLSRRTGPAHGATPARQRRHLA